MIYSKENTTTTTNFTTATTTTTNDKANTNSGPRPEIQITGRGQ